ncbi:MAG: oligoribonuclease [Myxococcota bacterium]
MGREGRLVWIDLEMTGLDPQIATIVEIATIVTDGDLHVVAEGPNLVIHQPEDALARMEPVVQQMHERSGLTAKIRASELSLAEAEAQTLAFIEQQCDERKAPRCGNSIWKDRQVLTTYMKSLDAYLHYRCIDVSTIKELGRRWYPGFSPPAKKEAHRALDDILESIDELRHYRRTLFVTPAD